MTGLEVGWCVGPEDGTLFWGLVSYEEVSHTSVPPPNEDTGESGGHVPGRGSSLKHSHISALLLDFPVFRAVISYYSSATWLEIFYQTTQLNRDNTDLVKIPTRLNESDGIFSVSQPIRQGARSEEIVGRAAPLFSPLGSLPACLSNYMRLHGEPKRDECMP